MIVLIISAYGKQANATTNHGLGACCARTFLSALVLVHRLVLSVRPTACLVLLGLQALYMVGSHVLADRAYHGSSSPIPVEASHEGEVLVDL